MKILALETSAKAVSVAVAENGKILCSRFANAGQTHSVTMMPMLNEMLNTAALTLDDIGAVAVAHGPGSFTGLRIGVSAAKGLAWAKGLPCCGVSTLEAMAENGRHFEGLIIGAMDARRNQIYNALFLCQGGKMERLTPDRAIGLSELLAEIKNRPEAKLVVGDGAELCYNYLTENNISCQMLPGDRGLQSAEGVGKVACVIAAQGQLVPPQALNPVYLRLSQAERERLAKGLPITLE